MTAAAMPATPTRTGARFTSFALLVTQVVLVTAYLGLVVSPFFVHDLHHKPQEYVAGGYFDPKELWPAPIALPMSILASLAWAFTGYLSVLVLLACLVTVATQWRRLLPAGFARIAATIVLGAALFHFQWFTEIGALLSAWMAD